MAATDPERPASEAPQAMPAVLFRRYGSPRVLEVARAARPRPAAGEVLLRVVAAGLNPFDLHMLYGDPYLMRPMVGTGLRKPKLPVIPGSDVAGIVDSVGEGVTRFQAGDEVYGSIGTGGLAEFAAAREKALALKPRNLTFEEAAAVPMAATTALQALRDHGKLQPGQRVLVNGASGGIGSFAVQLARALGAGEVTGVCSGHNVEFVRSLGADAAIDYTTEDFTRGGRRYDLIVDTAAGHSIRSLCRALGPDGTLVVVGAGGGHLIGPLGQIVQAAIVGKFVRQRVTTMLARITPDDLTLLAELIDAGKVRPAVERTYPLSESADAFRRLETRHVRGKVVIEVRGA